jgi:hypothetical protein
VADCRAVPWRRRSCRTAGPVGSWPSGS